MEKIKKYIQLFNCLTKTFIGENKLFATFEAITGGKYEAIYFKLIFENPYVFKMPYFHEGEFEIELIKDLKNQNFIEKEFPEGFEQLFVIKDKLRKINFYVLCDSIDFEISGNNASIVSEKELKIDQEI